MARYILIDTNSGYIFGDTADYAGGKSMSPVEAAKALDESVGEYSRAYTEHSRLQHDTRTGYAVYRADVDGSEAVPIVHDGQDRDTIETVMRDCEFVCFVEATARDS